VSKALDQPAAGSRADGSKQKRARAKAARARRQQMRTQLRTLVLTTFVLAAGLVLIWLTKTVLEIEGDAVFIALLLVPIVVFLAVTDRLKSFSLGGLSAEFRDLVTAVDKNVTNVGQREAERATYLGKLRQVLGKDKRKPALIYADVDELRRVTREIYLDERNDKSRGGSIEGRRREEKIRGKIIDCLEFALTDAFYDASVDKAKFDVFRMFEPDIAMIVRYVEPQQARQIAELAEKNFAESAESNFQKRCTATASVLSVKHISGKPSPEELDKMAADALEEAKDERKSQP
jgi:hypothetical protein